MRRKYRIRMYTLTVLTVFIIMGIPIVIYVMTRQLLAAGIALLGGSILGLMMYLSYRVQDTYISSIVQDLSRLMDMLTELEEKDIFPENEDVLVSKLQNKVLKLTKILKNNSRMEKEEHERIKELVSDLSHQLKTPIATMNMYTHFLENDKVMDEERASYIKVIGTALERLTFLSENMIKISRLESGLIQLNSRNQNLNETILQAVKNIYMAAKEKQVEIVYKEEGQLSLSHDRNWTAEAIFNLLDNAVKYSEHGKKVCLSVRRLGIFAEISVRDENKAIPEREKNQIFKRFYRGQDHGNKDGLGLGLYLAKDIALKQGVYINLSTSKAGNTFSMFLPM